MATLTHYTGRSTVNLELEICSGIEPHYVICGNNPSDGGLLSATKSTDRSGISTAEPLGE